MSQIPNPKNTPNRRRPQGRNRNTPQKTYASENDLPTYKPDLTRSPSTPQKLTCEGGTNVRTTSLNQKSRNKGNKSRNNRAGGTSSPGQILEDRASPSFVPKDAKDPIFAGSTFHASPLPSALPIPSFLGRSNSDSPRIKLDPIPSQDLSPPTSDSEEPSPPSQVPVPRNEESPLELFFRADRAEKARTRRASSANAAPLPLGPFSPPQEPPQQSNTVPKAMGSHQPQRPNYTYRNSASSIAPSELDGTPGQPLGPAFSTPYQERIRAARSNQSSAQATPTTAGIHDLSSSEALKRYLFTGKLGPVSQHFPTVQDHHSPQSPEQLPRQQGSDHSEPRRAPRTDLRHQPLQQRVPEQSSSQRQLPPGLLPASVLTSYASNTHSVLPPSRDNIDRHHHSDRVTAMEDSLRRMLKLDSSG